MKASDAIPAKGNSRKTIEWIVEVATHEFADHGLEGARLDRIAQSAGVTRRLIYHYFGTLRNLYVAVLEKTSQATFDEINAVEFDCLEPAEALQALLGVIFDQYRSSPNLIKLLTDQNMQECLQAEDNRLLKLGGESVVAIAAKSIERGQATKQLRQAINVRKWLAIAFVTITGCLAMRRTLVMTFGYDLTTPEALDELKQEVITNLVNTLKAPHQA